MSLHFTVNQARYINKELEIKIIRLENLKAQYLTRLKRINNPQNLANTVMRKIPSNCFNGLSGIQKAKLLLKVPTDQENRQLNNTMISFNKQLTIKVNKIEKLKSSIKGIKFQIKSKKSFTI